MASNNSPAGPKSTVHAGPEFRSSLFRRLFLFLEPFGDSIRCAIMNSSRGTDRPANVMLSKVQKLRVEHEENLAIIEKM